MKLFSRTSSPLSLSLSLSPSPPPPSPPNSRPETPTSSSNLSTLSLPPLRRPRLRHGAPPFFAGWATVRATRHCKKELRFCTLSGPMLTYSASPSQDVLARSILVYAALISSEEFPHLKIVIRSPSDRVVLYPETRRDHAEWVRELQVASLRSLGDVYECVRDLRPGGFGQWTMAMDKATLETVAVKCVRKELMHMREILMARREAIVLLGISEHPNLVKVVDMYESGRCVYLVIHDCAAETLEEWVAKKGVVCESQVAEVVKGVLRGLVHLHRGAIAHRLICPDNVWIASRDQTVTTVKLANFEMAVTAADTEQAVGVAQGFRRGGILQTKHCVYVAPEVAAGDVGDYAQDVWSVGILMHYLLVGCTPFEGWGKDVDAVLKRIAAARGIPVFGGALWRGISSGAKHLCASMLHADPAMRVKAAHALEHPWLNV